MMTNLLFSQATAIGKRFAMVLTMLLIVGIGQVWGAEVTFNKDGFSSSDKTETKENVTLTFDAVTINNQQIRFNSNNKMIVTSSAGNITRIDVTTNSTETYISPLGNTVSSGSWNKTSATKYYWVGNASSVTLTPNAAIRITEVKVTYGGSGDDDPNDNSGGTYTIVFASGTNTTATTSSVQLTTMIESGSENVSSFSIDATDTFVYHKGAGTSNNTGSGLRLGKSNGKGKITFNLSNTISTACLSELTISTVAWDASTTITLIINGDKNLTYTTTAGENLTYRPSNPIQLSSITLSADKRAFIQAINITTTQCTTQPTQLATPTELNVTNITSTSATLSWGEVANASSYVVTIMSDDLSKEVTCTQTSYTLEELTPGAEYLWTVKAVGNGTNYTDSEESEIGEFTTLAAASPATITLSELGITTTDNTTYSVGDSYTLPSTSSQSCDGKQLVGWSTVEVAETNTKPTSNYYELGATVTLTEDNTTFYAVFAEGSGEPTETSIIGGDCSSGLTTDWTTSGTDTYSNNGVKFDDTGDYIMSPAMGSSGYTNILLKFKAGHNGGSGSVLTFYAYGTDNALLTSEQVTISPNTITPTEAYTEQTTIYEVSIVATKVIDQIAIQMTSKTNNLGMKYCELFTISSGYTNYTTTCVPIPDPVWGGAEIDNATIAVNCGDTSSMNSAATISFPAKTNNTLTYDITVTASDGFLVSTNQTNNAGYGESVTVSPVKTGDNAGTITQNVYVRAVAPAMSSAQFTGTITISGKQIETQTIEVTADVTCTQYTLTLVDRGVSTEQPTKYYAGETIDEAPADPTGVCTDPIHYVFDGWAAATVDEGSTTYTKVTFPYTVTGNTKFCAVYRYVEEGSADSGDYVKVTEDLDDYSGDYLIVYEAGGLALNGALEGDDLDASGNSISVTITDNTIVATDEVNASNFTIAKEDDGYSIRSASGYYIGQTTNGNDLKTNSTEYYANTITLADDDNVDIVSSGAYLRYNAATGNTNLRFRYYKSDTYTSQKAIALYRKAASYLYTTSPVCGPMLEITSGKDIYVTSGYNSTTKHNTVIAQQKVEYRATRLNKNGDLVPDVKVATNDITINGEKTEKVKVDITQNKEEIDGKYTITGTITIQYTPTENNTQEDIQVQLAVDYNAEARDNFTVHARSLPQEFVIVAKQNDKWYALNGDMSGSDAEPANGQITVDNIDNPTIATYAPCNTIYTFDGMVNTGDKSFVRFQGTDGAWLWAASGTNVGVQNKTLAQTPAGDNTPYNWKIETSDNISYFFHNANSSRVLRLNDGKFGMYVGGTDVIRILPYEAKCLYNYAPSNLKVSVLKGTSVTLTWDAVAGATKYQYSTDATTWTDAGTEPTITINGLNNATEYTYYIRAYHEDAGVTQECFDYSEVTFTTANCDDVPTDIICSSDLNSILVSWTANAATSTVKLYSDEAGTTEVQTLTSVTSPCKFTNLTTNTTYYVQVFANGTCASQIVQVSTEDVKVDVVEWLQNGIIVDINTDETIGVTLENEVSYGSGTGAEATELFFSKYYEATTNVKLVAIYNGTKNIIDLTPYTIQYGKTSWESNYITLKDFGETKGQIQPGEELILYTMGTVNSDAQIMDCVNEAYPDGKWVRVTQTNNDGGGHLSFAGDKTIVLKKSGTIIDIIGAIDSNGLPTNTAVTEPSWGDAKGWTCDTGLSIADNTEIGISTNRCLLIRNNDVTSGANAVGSNVDNFVTLCSEWKGAHVPDNDVDNGVAASCENFAYVGTFDYSDYYTQYEKLGNDLTFEENQRNPDGTVTIPIAELYKQSCRNIRITLSNSSNEVLSNREYKVPIMVAFDQTTADTVFTNMQNYLATIEKDDEDKIVNTHQLTLDEVREICKTCDIIIRDGATLTHVADGIDQFQDITIYPTAKLSNINTALTVNKLMIQSEIIDNIDTVGYAIIEQNGGSLTANAIGHTKRIDAQWWYPFSLPYDCDIADITQANGESMGEYGVHWGIQYYDGERRQKEGTSASLGQSSQYWTPMAADDRLNAHQGYVIALFDASVQSPTEKRTIYFPPVDESKYTESGSDAKKTNVYNWNVNLDAAKRHHGWNFTGSPYISMFNPTAAGITHDALDDILMTGYYEGKYSPFEDTYEEDGLVYITAPIPPSSLYYRQRLATTTSLKPFAAYFVQTVDPTTSNNETKNLTYVKGGRELPASAPARAAATKQRVLVELNITAPDGQTDNTGIWVDERYTTDYEIAADLTKMYATGTRPQLYTLAANNEKLAYNALPDNAATNIPLGLYAPKAGDYTLTLNERVSRVAGAETVELLYNNQVVANLLYQDYTITANKGTVSGYSLSIRRRADVSTAVDNTTGSTITLIANDEYISLVGVPTDATISIYDMLGRLISSQQANGQSVVNMPIVPQGVYNIVVANGTGYTTIKSVIK